MIIVVEMVVVVLLVVDLRTGVFMFIVDLKQIIWTRAGNPKRQML